MINTNQYLVLDYDRNDTPDDLDTHQTAIQVDHVALQDHVDARKIGNVCSSDCNRCGNRHHLPALTD